MNKCQAALIIVYLSFGPTLCFGGEIRIDVRPADISGSSLSVSGSSELSINKKDERTWVFSFPSKFNIEGKLSIAIDNPPSGYDKFRMDLAIPFFLEQSLPFKIGAAISNDDLSDIGAADFVRSVGVGPAAGAIADNVLTHERARRYWSVRSKQLDAGIHQANSDDIGVAYWLLFTTRNLITTSYVEIDEATYNATEFVKKKLNDPRESSRLFNPKIVSRDVASNLVASIESRDSYVYLSIVNKLEGRLKISDYSVCDKIQYLGNRVLQMPEYQLPQFNGEYPTSIKIKSDAISCIAHSIDAQPDLTDKSLRENYSSSIEDLIESANDDIAQGATSIAVKSSIPGIAPTANDVANYSQALTSLQQRVSEISIYKGRLTD
jgi:hypothetical protein